MFMQLAHGGATDHHRHFVIAQRQTVTVSVAGLQGEGAQTEGDGKTSAAAGVGKAIKDAAIGEGLAATGGGHVDAEKTLLLAALAQPLGEFKSPVLPSKRRDGALAKASMNEMGQLVGQSREGADNATGIDLDADQVLIEALLELAGLAISVGIQGFALAGLVAEAFVAGLAGVVVIGEHQGQPREVQQIG